MRYLKGQKEMERCYQNEGVQVKDRIFKKHHGETQNLANDWNEGWEPETARQTGCARK